MVRSPWINHPGVRITIWKNTQAFRKRGLSVGLCSSLWKSWGLCSTKLLTAWGTVLSFCLHGKTLVHFMARFFFLSTIFPRKRGLSLKLKACLLSVSWFVAIVAPMIVFSLNFLPSCFSAIGLVLGIARAEFSKTGFFIITILCAASLLTIEKTSLRGVIFLFQEFDSLPDPIFHSALPRIWIFIPFPSFSVIRLH